MGASRLMTVTCPWCGSTRDVRSKVRIDIKACRKCARKHATKKPNLKPYEAPERFRTPVDDPWDSIKCEAVTANQLHDGWAG